MSLSLAFHMNECRSPAVNLNLWRSAHRQTLERELPIFLNLLKITAQSGFSLPQSLKCLNQSADTSCPRLIKTFATILDGATAADKPLSEALTEASRDSRVDIVSNLMIALAKPVSNTEELLQIINSQIVIADALQERRCSRLRKNYWRRWTPHVLFFLLCVLPMSLSMMLGPALTIPSRLWAIGPNDYGIRF